MPASGCGVREALQEHQQSMLLHQDCLGRKALRVAVLQRPNLCERTRLPQWGSLHAEYLLRP